MKVVHSFKVFPPDVDGGIPEIIQKLALGHSSLSHNVIITARPFGKGVQEKTVDFHIKKISSIGQLMSTPISPSYPWALKNELKDADLAVLHSPFPLADIGIYLLADKSPPLIVHWHSDIDRQFLLEPMLRPLLRATLDRAKTIIVSHERIFASSPLLQDFAHKVVTVPFGVDAAHWSVLTEEERNSADALRHRYPRLVVAVGRLVAYKGFDVLIDAMADVDGHLMLVGTGRLRSRLDQQIAQSGQEYKVILAGYVPEETIKIYLHASRALILPSVSNSETFGLVQLEAMAAARAVVNTNLPTAVPEIARHEREALTVPPSDPKALAQAINRILDDCAFAQRLGEAGQARARSDFKLEEFVQRCWQIYEATATLNSKK